MPHQSIECSEPLDNQRLQRSLKLVRLRHADVGQHLRFVHFEEKSFPGQHEAITQLVNHCVANIFKVHGISSGTKRGQLRNLGSFLVHAFIERRKQVQRKSITQHSALLTGLLYAPDGQLMIHSFTRKKSGRLYRYYVPYLHKRRNAGATLAPGLIEMGPLPAAEIETAVLEQIHKALCAPELMLATWRSCQKHPKGAKLEEAQVVVAMQRIGAVWDQLFPQEQQRITQLLIERVHLHERGLDILWREDGWLGFSDDIHNHPLVEETKGATEEVYA